MCLCVYAYVCICVGLGVCMVLVCICLCVQFVLINPTTRAHTRTHTCTYTWYTHTQVAVRQILVDNRTLIDQGFLDLNKPTTMTKSTFLHTAVWYRWVNIVRWLLDPVCLSLFLSLSSLFLLFIFAVHEYSCFIYRYYCLYVIVYHYYSCYYYGLLLLLL